MNQILTYLIIFIVLLVCELIYFKIADVLNIIDKPNERSSHSSIVLRGGGIIFSIAMLIWFGSKVVFGLEGFEGYNGCYPWFMLGMVLVSGVSFIDDIRSLPDSLRLVVHFIGMALMFYQLSILHLDMWWVVALCLFVCVGATNVINFMDGVNGITGAYTMATLIPLLLLNTNPELTDLPSKTGGCFVDNSLILTVGLADIVFCLFNFRPKGKARCFAGDVGSVGVAFVLLFLIGSLVMQSGDPTYLIFLIVYGVDGVMTICHRILLHENLGQAHRKHAYQIMANELRMSHLGVSVIYMGLQLAISLGFIYLCPNNPSAHWIYLLSVLLILCIAYLLFMKKYYHLHEEWLAGRRR